MPGLHSGTSNPFSTATGLHLRVHIDGKWNATEFSEYFRCINLVYAVATVHTFNDILGNAEWISPELGLQIALNEYTLLNRADWETDDLLGKNVAESLVIPIRRIQFASPGFTDLGGVGKALEKTYSFLKFIIEYHGGAQ